MLVFNPLNVIFRFFCLIKTHHFNVLTCYLLPKLTKSCASCVSWLLGHKIKCWKTWQPVKNAWVSMVYNVHAYMLVLIKRNKWIVLNLYSMVAKINTWCSKSCRQFNVFCLSFKNKIDCNQEASRTTLQESYIRKAKNGYMGYIYLMSMWPEAKSGSLPKPLLKAKDISLLVYFSNFPPEGLGLLDFFCLCVLANKWWGRS